jgi:glycyl-tRNA synthetase beta chain
MAEYFFELLTEEIPAWMHDGAAAALQTQLAKLSADLGVEPNEQHPAINVSTTPRRIIFVLARLPLREDDREEEVKGPPAKAAYDADGNPTQALHGFLRKNNAALRDAQPGGGDYVRIRRRITGRPTTEIVQQRVPQIIEGLRWPKMMRWGNGEHAYIRPVHSVISMFEGEHLPLAIFGVHSGATTVGHRTLAPKRFDVASYNDYVTKLELNRVVIDPLRRRHVMAERARVLGGQVKGTPSVDASIWSQWQYLTEYPGVVRAEFRPEYLSLPDEVLVTVMRVHQKQLPIRDASGKLTNSFLAVLDNDSDPDGNAAYGNSFVTNARFADARFFYDTDRRKKLEERLEALEHLQFQEKLGNYRQKSDRIVRITGAIGGDDDALAAARLCKCDLVTEMVKEFTDLQGQIGGIYAREEGQPEGVWQAIYDHYLPLSADDALPRTHGGALVALADKIDTIVGFFAVGLKPTGSKDPFALRRAAQGIVQILLNRDKRQVKIGFSELIEAALEAHRQPSNPATQQLKTDLVAFFAERVLTILETSAYGFAYDEIRAAMESGWDSLTDLVDRITAIKAVREDRNFLSILDSAKRIANITEGHVDEPIDPSLLEHESEKRLYELASGREIAQMIADRDYRRALEAFAAMAPALETFFEDVMVNVEDPRVRRNRMSLLRKVGSAVKKIGDVTKIVVDRSEYRS